MSRALAFVFCALVCAPAFAQVYYLPVQYQHSVGNQTFYYGGSNPHLLRYGRQEAQIQIIASNNGVFNHPYQEHSPVYSDVLPYRDMTDYGFTAANAANEANANVPRYFRKSDLLKAAIPQADGSYVVPADAQPVCAANAEPIQTNRPMPTTHKGEIIIIPKSMLNRPLKDFMPRPRQVASAN